MKRLIDIIISSFLLLLLSPILLLALALIIIKLGRPCLFKQVRPGLNKKPFTILKFRTMEDASDPSGNSLPDEQRLSSFGKILRSTSIDELPALWNVLKGDMSLIGPRPLLMEYLPLYSTEQNRRHDMRPGISGWAQVNGRNTISWEDKFKLDIWYIENQSFWLDVKILLLTIKKVFIREGINANGEATMQKFTGS